MSERDPPAGAPDEEDELDADAAEDFDPDALDERDSEDGLDDGGEEEGEEGYYDDEEGEGEEEEGDPFAQGYGGFRPAQELLSSGGVEEDEYEDEEDEEEGGERVVETVVIDDSDEEGAPQGSSQLSRSAQGSAEEEALVDFGDEVDDDVAEGEFDFEGPIVLQDSSDAMQFSDGHLPTDGPQPMDESEGTPFEEQHAEEDPAPASSPQPAREPTPEPAQLAPPPATEPGARQQTPKRGRSPSPQPPRRSPRLSPQPEPASEPEPAPAPEEPASAAQAEPEQDVLQLRSRAVVQTPTEQPAPIYQPTQPPPPQPSRSLPKFTFGAFASPSSIVPRAATVGFGLTGAVSPPQLPTPPRAASPPPQIGVVRTQGATILTTKAVSGGRAAKTPEEAGEVIWGWWKKAGKGRKGKGKPAGTRSAAPAPASPAPAPAPASPAPAPRAAAPAPAAPAPAIPAPRPAASLAVAPQPPVDIHPPQPTDPPADHPLLRLSTLLDLPPALARSLFAAVSANPDAGFSELWAALDRWVSMGEEGRRAAREAREVEEGHRAHAAEERARELEGRLAKAEEAKKEAERNAAEREENMNRLRADLSRAAAGTDAAEGTLAPLRQRIAVLESENRELASALDRRAREAESMRGEADAASGAARELRTRLLDAETALAEAKAGEEAARWRAEAAAAEAKEVKGTAEWLRGEHDREREGWAEWRRARAEETARLRGEVEGAKAAAEDAEARASRARGEAEDARSRCERLAGQLRDAEGRLAVQEGAFAREMEAMRRVSKLNEERAAELQRAFEEAGAEAARLQAEREAALEAAERRAREAAEGTKALQGRLEEKEKESAELRTRLAEVDRLVGDEVSREVVGTRGKRSELGALSRTAEIAESMRRGGKSFTEIYLEYVALQSQVGSIRLDNNRLQAHLQHILDEVEMRASFYQKQGEDLDRALADVSRLQKELDSRSRRLDQVELERIEMAKRTERLEAAAKADQQEIRDLQRQIQVLLREVESLNPSVPTGAIGSPADFEGIVPEMADEGGTADQLISSNLVGFRNVRDLQARNQQLLRAVRELTAKAEAEERDRDERVSDTVRSALENAARKLEEADAKLAAYEQRNRALETERDMLKQLAHNRTGSAAQTRAPPSPTMPAIAAPPAGPARSSEEQRSLAEIQELLDAVREESSKDMGILKQQIDSLRNENFSLVSESKKKEAELNFIQERFSLLQKSYETQQSDVVSLRTRIAQTVATSQAQEAKVQELSADLLDAKKNVDRLRAEVAMLRSEKEVAKAAEARLMQESNSLSVERNKLAEVMKQIQAMSAEMQRSEGELRRQAERRVIDLEKELAEARKQLAASVDEFKLMVGTKDREARELNIKLDKSVSLGLGRS
ncbi:hypothetical protein DFJ74DRAFT_87245 [Hyaloraphidium curvatum]|nr:hypothetical protein DFJ74DRAFT_87245 [Hyaloraphidium curvatum]